MDPPSRSEPFHPVAALARLGLAWAFSAAYLSAVVLLSIVTLRRLSGSLISPAGRFWGRSVLAILGVRLDVEGFDRLDGWSPRILVFNHASTLDVPILAALLPPGALGLAKKEIAWVPFLGLAWWALDQVFLDRSDPERARASVARAARRMREEERTAVIAPEGTRSPDGTLQAFKMGAFHLAVQSGAPIVPAIVQGAADRLPLGAWRIRPGTIRVRVLPPIPTDDRDESSVRSLAAEVRDVFVRALEDPVAVPTLPHLRSAADLRL